jgi:nucleotide-binding universal stress UspA family protein
MMFKNILVPTDGSARSKRAIRQAVQLAKEQNARVTGLYVAPAYRPSMQEEMPTLHFETPQKHAAKAKTLAHKHLKPIEKAASAAGIPFDLVHAASDYPYDEIVRTANRRKCDLIYMASHGRTGFSRLMLGSQTSKVLAYSKVPVIVTR